MSKSLYSFAALAILLVFSAASAMPVFGQDDESNGDETLSRDEIAQIYGMGVHAYFSGNASEAEAVLTTAIDAGTRDPRVYYFRGLAQLKLGNTEAATKDFKAGAEIEASPKHDPVNVNYSLMRVQGAPRIEIETLRATAKKEAAEKLQREHEERYNRIKANEDRVLDKSRSGQGQSGGGA